jgi:hypothetical protein
LPSASRQTTDGHSQETGQQHDVSKKSEIENVRREPANASQLEKQYQQANQEKLAAFAETG